jgi:hypothetical protein
MGKSSVSLRQRLCSRLSVEHFEDRQLLSGFRALSVLNHNWLTANVTSHPASEWLSLIADQESASQPKKLLGEEEGDKPSKTLLREEKADKPSKGERSAESDNVRSKHKIERFLDDLKFGDWEISLGDVSDNTAEKEEGSSSNRSERGEAEAEAEFREQIVLAEDTLPDAGGLPDSTVDHPVVGHNLKHLAPESGDPGDGSATLGQVPPAESTPPQVGGNRVPGHAQTEHDSSDKAASPSLHKQPINDRRDGADSNREPDVSPPDGSDVIPRFQSDLGGLPAPQDHVAVGGQREAGDLRGPAQDPHRGRLLPPRAPETNPVVRGGRETAETKPVQQAAVPGEDQPRTVSANRIETALSVGPVAPSQSPAVFSTVATAQAMAVAEASVEIAHQPDAAHLGIVDVAVFVPHMSGLLDGIVPFDVEAVQAAMQQFLEQVENLGGNAASWLAQMNVSPWVVAVAIGLTTCDVIRRRQQRAQRGRVITDDDGTPLTWCPGLAGAWTMQDA